MTTQIQPTALPALRARLLRNTPLQERRLTLAGLPTTLLEGGDGPPIVLLHGPGEDAVNWRWVTPDLVTTHRVLAPDLPAHGTTGADPARLDEDGALAWLAELIGQTCTEPPTLVGHVLGGAIAARFAIRHPDRLRRLVLVDSLGLARFRPSIPFALGFARFAARPTERSYDRFMQQCASDLDALRRRVGEDWEPFAAYNVGLAQAPSSRAASKLFRRVGTPRITAEDLDRIAVPTTLIWGRQDRALKVRIAEDASARRGWSLHVIDGAADDPARDQPQAFLRALRQALAADGP